MSVFFTKEVLWGEINNGTFCTHRLFSSVRGCGLSLIHFPNYYVIWKKGISPVRITEFRRPWLIGRKVTRDKLPPYKEWVGALQHYKGEYKNIDYLLLRGGYPQKDHHYFENFDVISHINEWYILKNKNASDN